jgi:hypothetical protein
VYHVNGIARATCTILFLYYLLLTIDMRPPDLDQFRAPKSGTLQPKTSKRPPRHRAGGWFLKGPIPGDWLQQAAKLPGKTLHVALALWYAAGRSNQRTVKLTHEVLALFGVDRHAGRRAVDRMAAVGLVSADCKRGRCPIVTLQEVETKGPAVTALEMAPVDPKCRRAVQNNLHGSTRQTGS